MREDGAEAAYARSHSDRKEPETILADYQRLKEENAAVRRLLVENGITIPAPADAASPRPPAPGFAGARR
jgi:hypothetical protein